MGVQNELTATLLVWRRSIADPSAPPEAEHAQQDCLMKVPLSLPVAAMGTAAGAAEALVQLMLDSRYAAKRTPWSAGSAARPHILAKLSCQYGQA